MIVVARPRIDPAALPAAEGLEVVAYVHTSTATSPHATSRWSRED